MLAAATWYLNSGRGPKVQHSRSHTSMPEAMEGHESLDQAKVCILVAFGRYFILCPVHSVLLYSCHILQILICVDTCHGGVIIFILSVSSQYKITRTVGSVQILNYWNTVRIIKWLHEISFVCILKLSSVSSVKASLTFILHHQRNGKLIDNKMFFELLFSGKRFVFWQPDRWRSWTCDNWRIDHHAMLFILFY